MEGKFEVLRNALIGDRKRFLARRSVVNSREGEVGADKVLGRTVVVDCLTRQLRRIDGVADKVGFGSVNGGVVKR